MNRQNVDVVLRAIQRRMANGYASLTLTQLVADTELSQSTVQRAIQAIQTDNLLAVERKRGHSGGFLFGPPNWSQSGQQSGQQTGQNWSACNAFNQTGQGTSSPDLTSLDGAQTGQQTGQTAPTPENENVEIGEYEKWKWHIPELDAETRRRGAAFFREMRKGLNNP